MKNSLLIIVSVVLMGVSSNVNAQQYRTGLGGRFGDFNGFTVKHFISGENAIEGLLSFNWGGTVITGLYEYQKPISGAPGLDWYVGIGGHIGFWGEGKYYRNDDYRNHSYTIIGIDLLGGLEYSFKEVPFSIGLDWKPAINVNDDSYFWANGLGLSIRYDIR